ncbi:MAG TPA: LssY C-terminal domain-containing protein [Planctomycetaceae bacterium]|nr:LssY C-terminal domain-containing protein [Planctomycetaceae bacterium]
MAFPARQIFQRLFTVAYHPDSSHRSYLARAQTQHSPLADVTVAVLDAAESERLFGVPLARRDIQPVFLRVVNRSQTHLRLHVVSIDRNYYTPLEAAGVSHFSIAKRLSAFAAIGWWLFLPLFVLIPFKLVSAYRANRRMDEQFQAEAFRLRPVPAGDAAEGFVFTHMDVGTKVVRVLFHAASSPFDLASLPSQIADPATYRPPPDAATGQPVVDLTFTIAVPGIAADYLRRDFAALYPSGEFSDCDLPTLVQRLSAMPPATTNSKETHTGDPVNLVVIGEFETILSAFGARWDESETITLRTCWKTARSFLLGSQYRYSPVSPLHLLGRTQDLALQRSRRSINERLHLRLWLTTLRFGRKPVWIGQISRDIGVRFTPKTWNLTTHRIDPDVDESRDYVVEDLMEAERIDAVGYVDGVGACEQTAPKRNLTGDPYFTDGRRAVILLAETRAAPRFVRWC